MANTKQPKENRRPARFIAAGRSEKKQKKVQDRLARQEQKMAEKLERQAGTSPRKPKSSAPKPTAPSQETAPRSRPAKKTSHSAKQTLHKVKGGFQVIVGGRRKRLFRIGAVVAALLTVVLLVNLLVPVGVWEYVENVVAGFGSGNGFPVSISTSKQTQLAAMGGDTALLGDSSLSLYKSNGKLLFDRQHSFSSPAIATSTSRVLLYDRGHTGVRMENRAKTIFSLEAKGDLVTANIAYNGHFALVTGGGNYVADVTVYDEDGLERYTWHSATRQVLGVALSDNGRYVAVSTLHVAGGEAVTGLLMFDTRDNATVFEQAYKSEMALSLAFKDDVAVAILTDRVVSFDADGGKKEHIFESGRPLCYDNHDTDTTVILLQMFQNANSTRLLVFDNELTLTGQRDIASGGVAISAKGSDVALLTNDKVVFYDTEAKPKSIMFLAADTTDLVCHGSSAILLEHHRLAEAKK